MSKLSFRARALDASKQMPIFMAEELPDLPEYSAINRAVPQMPSGMEKEEECEHHLQRAICAGLIIPTPEVSAADPDAYNRLYPPDYKQPRQLIHMQPFAMEQDIPDYDMDSEDERWLVLQAKKLDLTPLKFEEMMDRLEKSSGQTVVTLNEAKALLKEDDDLIIAVFDYWLNKRLKTQHPLILSVKTEHRTGLAANNPYLAFRRRTEKMQTRKNRKNDETSYEKMLKLRRDLSRAVTLLELVKRREKTKREHLHLTIEVFEKRWQSQDYSGALVSEVSSIKQPIRPAFTQLFQNHWDELPARKEKRQYKRRKHKNARTGVSSDEDEIAALDEASPTDDDEGRFAFHRDKHCSYHMPLPGLGNWPWCSPEDNGLAEKKYRYALTSLGNPQRTCIGLARRRVGRGGRVILDRATTSLDDYWRKMDFTILDVKSEPGLHFRPKTPPSEGIDAAPERVFPMTLELQPSRDLDSALLDDSVFTTVALQQSTGGGDVRCMHEPDRTFGCSRFRVVDSSASDGAQVLLTCSECDSAREETCGEDGFHNRVSNGPLSDSPHSDLSAVSNRKGNKMQHNAYQSGVWSSRGANNATHLGSHPTLTTHTTLNSHSANLLEMSRAAASPGEASTVDSKQGSEKPLVRKNNSLAMEVT